MHCLIIDNSLMVLNIILLSVQQIQGISEGIIIITKIMDFKLQIPYRSYKNCRDF